VKSALAELKMAVRSDMSEANITAIMMPLNRLKGQSHEIVKSVLVELKMAVRSDMSAANITAIMMPLEHFKGSVSQDCEECAG
jgi:hypothetical protein